jgi:hypothetical protein
MLTLFESDQAWGIRNAQHKATAITAPPKDETRTRKTRPLMTPPRASTGVRSSFMTIPFAR